MFDPVSALGAVGAKMLSIGETLIEKLVPDRAAREKARAELTRMAMQGELDQLAREHGIMHAQIEVNREEARHSSVFVSGWRPFIGWICGTGLAIQYIVHPFASWALALTRPDVVLPQLQGEALFTILSGMLGIAGLRSWEKARGVARG